MKARELRELTDEELYTRLGESHQELFNLRFQSTTRQLTNHRRIAQVRRTIARINTILRERELSAVAQGAGRAEPVQEANSLAS